jgi:hypothetical protein
MAMLPSPTADATRLTGLSRTSPGKNARSARFKEVGIAAEWPTAGFPKIVARKNITASVPGNIRRQPLSFSVSPYKDKQAGALMPTNRRARTVANVDCREMAIAMDRLYL